MADDAPKTIQTLGQSWRTPHSKWPSERFRQAFTDWDQSVYPPPDSQRPWETSWLCCIARRLYWTFTRSGDACRRDGYIELFQESPLGRVVYSVTESGVNTPVGGQSLYSWFGLFAWEVKVSFPLKMSDGFQFIAYIWLSTELARRYNYDTLGTSWHMQ